MIFRPSCVKFFPHVTSRMQLFRHATDALFHAIGSDELSSRGCYMTYFIPMVYITRRHSFWIRLYLRLWLSPWRGVRKGSTRVINWFFFGVGRCASQCFCPIHVSWLVECAFWEREEDRGRSVKEYDRPKVGTRYAETLVKTLWRT